MVERQITVAAGFEPGTIITREGQRFRAVGSSEAGTIFSRVTEASFVGDRPGGVSRERPEVLAAAKARASTVRASREFRPQQTKNIKLDRPEVSKVKLLFSESLSPKVRSILAFEAADGGGLEGAKLQRFENLKAELANEKSNIDSKIKALKQQQKDLAKEVDTFNSDQDRLKRLARNNLLQEGVAIKNKNKAKELNEKINNLNKKTDDISSLTQTFNKGIQAVNRTEQRANVSAGKKVSEIKTKTFARLEAAPTTGEVRERLEFPPEQIIPTEAQFEERRAQTALGFQELLTGGAAAVGVTPALSFVQQLGLVEPVARFIGGAGEVFETGLRGVGAVAETGLGVVEEATGQPISLRVTLPRETAQLISGFEDIPIIGPAFAGIGVQPVTPTATELLFGKPQVARAAVAATELELLLGFPGTRAAVKGVKAVAKVPKRVGFGIEEGIVRVRGKLVSTKPTPADIFEAETLTLERFKTDFFPKTPKITAVERREFLTLLTGEPARKGVRQFGKQRIDLETILKREFPLPGEEPVIGVRTFDVRRPGLSIKERKEFERLLQDIGIARGERVIPRFFREKPTGLTGVEARELETALREPILFPEGIEARQILGFDAKQTRAALLEELGIKPKVSKRALATSKKFAADIKREAARLLKEERGELGSFEQIAGRLRQLQRRRRKPVRIIDEEEIIFQQFFGPVPKIVQRPVPTGPLTFERFLGAGAVGVGTVQAKKLKDLQIDLTAQLTGFAEVPALKTAKALKEGKAQRVSEAAAERTALASLLGVSTAQLTGTAQLEGLRPVEAVIPRARITPRTTPRIVPRITTFPRVPGPTRLRPPSLIPLLAPPTFEDLVGRPRRRRQGFKVRVKSGKKFRVITKKPLTEGTAKGLGASFVDRGVERTFDIFPVPGTPKSIASLENAFNPFKFRRPKRKTKLPRQAFVERSAFAIDTPGERQGITFKGLLALERRRGVRRILKVPTRRRKRKTKKKRRK